MQLRKAVRAVLWPVASLKDSILYLIISHMIDHSVSQLGITCATNNSSAVGCRMSFTLQFSEAIWLIVTTVPNNRLCSNKTEAVQNKEYQTLMNNQFYKIYESIEMCHTCQQHSHHGREMPRTWNEEFAKNTSQLLEPSCLHRSVLLQQPTCQFSLC
jgi:hypothetical protein